MPRVSLQHQAPSSPRSPPAQSSAALSTTSFLHRLTHPSSAQAFTCKEATSANFKLSFPRSSSPLFQLISPKTGGFKGDLSGSSRATSSSPGESGEVARQQFSLAGSVMLYAVIYKAQEEPAALKSISFSFPSSPTLLKPPLDANTMEDVKGRHQGHELIEHPGRKMALRERKGGAKRAGWGGESSQSRQNSSEDDGGL